MTSRTRYRIAMHQSDGTLVCLEQILALIAAPDLIWRITFFDGIARPDGGLVLTEIEDAVRAPGGMQLSHSELRDVAERLHQVIDLDGSGYLVTGAGLVDAEPVVVLEAFDSSTWTVTLDETTVTVRPDLLTALSATLVTSND